MPCGMFPLARLNSHYYVVPIMKDWPDPRTDGAPASKLEFAFIFALLATALLSGLYSLIS
jgi:hypothetical protein